MFFDNRICLGRDTLAAFFGLMFMEDIGWLDFWLTGFWPDRLRIWDVCWRVLRQMRLCECFELAPALTGVGPDGEPGLFVLFHVPRRGGYGMG